MKLDDLLLMSGNDIPFPMARVNIHQPTLKEIGIIFEENFHMGCHFLNFNKDNLNVEDKSNLETKSDFDIFMSVINSRGNRELKTDVQMVLALLFPQYNIEIGKDKILLHLENFSSSINETNFSDFKNILDQMFCLSANAGGTEYNPGDALAAKIAEKIKKGKEKKNQKKSNGKLTIFKEYISILSVGLQIDVNTLLNYTVYQINDEYKRFIAFQNWDIYIKAKLAGAQDLEEVTNWME